MIFMQKRLVTMKSNLTFVSLTYSVVLACGLLLGGHESWGEGICIGDTCYTDGAAAIAAYERGSISPGDWAGAVAQHPELAQPLTLPSSLSNPPSASQSLAALPSNAASNAAALDNLIASNAMGGDAGTTISNALQSGNITRQAVVDWMNDGLGGEPLKHLIGPNQSLQSVVEGGNISQEKADAIAKALGKNSAAQGVGVAGRPAGLSSVSVRPASSFWGARPARSWSKRQVPSFGSCR